MVEIKRKSMIYVDKLDFPKYKEILNKYTFKNNLHIFTCAVLIGKSMVNRTKPIKSSKDFVRTADNAHDENLVILKCLAIAEKNDVNIIVDESEMYKLVEGYARTGIDIMYDWFKSTEYDFETKLCMELIKIFNELDLDNLS